MHRENAFYADNFSHSLKPGYCNLEVFTAPQNYNPSPDFYTVSVQARANSSQGMIHRVMNDTISISHPRAFQQYS